MVGGKIAGGIPCLVGFNISNSYMNYSEGDSPTFGVLTHQAEKEYHETTKNYRNYRKTSSERDVLEVFKL
ncbi:hypothetical protein AKJ60_00720 [candidate division MSBL1 archaeon SCGC-AAA385M11]|nr:hypothetical protein AKJ60_00720 [candidate division MSBL1 archaeon SCGC-AAA385M11]